MGGLRAILPFSGQVGWSEANLFKDVQNNTIVDKKCFYQSKTKTKTKKTFKNLTKAKTKTKKAKNENRKYNDISVLSPAKRFATEICGPQIHRIGSYRRSTLTVANSLIQRRRRRRRGFEQINEQL